MKKSAIFTLLFLIFASIILAQEKPSKVNVLNTTNPVNLIYPADDQEVDINSTPILFEWTDPNPHVSSSEYQIVITRLTGKTGSGQRSGTKVSEVIIMDAKTQDYRIASLHRIFTPGATYRWKVRALYPGTTTAWSSTRQLRIKGGTNPVTLGEHCPNGGFENNDYSNWTGETNILGNTTWATGFTPGRFQIMNAGGFDPKVGGGILPVVPPGGGAHSIRMGNFNGAKQMERLTYNFIVDNTNKDFRFRFALILYDPTDHSVTQKPGFGYNIQVNNGSSWQTVASSYIVSDRNNPYFEISNNDPNLIYKLWNCNRIDLGSHIGKSARISFSTQDCSQGATNHFAVAYIDGVCGDESDVAPIVQLNIAPEFCLNSSEFIADGSASQGEIDYYWGVEKCDASGNPVAGTEKSQWFNGGEVGLMDIKSFYINKGGAFECNSYYKIRLKVSNDCVGNRETTKVIYLRCPVITPISDISMCCNNPTATMTMGVPNNPNYTYSWTTMPSNQIYTTSMITVPRPLAGLEQYKLYVKDQYGCSTGDVINVYTIPKFDITLNNSGCIPCQSTTLQVQTTPSSAGCTFPPASVSQLQSIGVSLTYNYQWSSGAGNTNINNVYTDVDKTFTVTVTDGCNNMLVKSTSVKRNKIVGGFPRLTFASALKPDYSDPLKHLLILDKNLVSSGDPSTGTTGSLNYGYKPAYNATAYRLYIVDRWGTIHKVKERSLSDCTGLSNGEIEWDGKLNGSIVQQGVYNWFLELENCDTNKDTLDWYQLVCTNYGFNIWCLCNECKKWEWQNTTQRINSVTVIR